MPIRLACSTITFRTSPLPQAVEEIRAAGFTAVELAAIPGFCPHFDPLRAKPAEWEALSALLEGNGLKTVAVTTVPGDFNRPGVDPAMILRRAQSYLKLAQHLGVPGLSLHCGVAIENRLEFRQHAVRQAQGLKKIAQMADGMGLRLALEAPHRNSLCQTVDEAEFLLEEIGEENVDILLDTSHLVAARVKPEDAVRRFAERIGHVHLRDAKGPDIFLTPGDGEVNFQRFFEALDEVDYSGWCAVELETRSEELDSRRRELRRAVDFLLEQADVASGIDFSRLSP